MGGASHSARPAASGVGVRRSAVGGRADRAGRRAMARRARAACESCGEARAALRRPATGARLCRACFARAFEDEVHATIVRDGLFAPGQRVAIGASGGKDSTVLAKVMAVLNERHGYGLNLFLLSVDEGIAGYRDDSLETVKSNERTYGIPLTIVSYKELYGWSMDEIVSAVGAKSNCTFCGVLRRQALERGARHVGADVIATGHNADDVAETVLLNLLRGDAPRLRRCTAGITGGEGGGKEGVAAVPRVKPLRLAYEKEIVMYAYFEKLEYFSTECIYSPNAYRGWTRDLIKQLEAARPRAILDVVRSGELMRFPAEEAGRGKATMSQSLGACERCGFMSSQRLCKACILLEGLNRGTPKLALGRHAKSLTNDAVAGVASGSRAGNDGAPAKPRRRLTEVL